MGEQLPGINQPDQRIEITADDLAPAPTSAAGPKPPAPSASVPIAGALPTVTDAKAPSAAKPAQKLPVGGTYCSGCGDPIHPQAVVCPRCGVATATAAQATGAAMAVALNSKSTGLAILLSLVFTGAGHWYVGRIGRGIGFFAAAFISGLLIFAVVGLVLLPIVWVCAAVDANKCAQEYNQLLMAQAGAQAPPAMLTG